jgi:L-threonylcarbamoyladenylate synthase
VEDDLGDAVAVVLDGGRCTGSPSTVVDCTGVEPRLLREGRVPWPQVLATI